MTDVAHTSRTDALACRDTVYVDAITILSLATASTLLVHVTSAI
jgi:hypothetical protein